jgi:two-component system CheB/CheR fusion protein
MQETSSTSFKPTFGRPLSQPSLTMSGRAARTGHSLAGVDERRMCTVAKTAGIPIVRRAATAPDASLVATTSRAGASDTVEPPVVFVLADDSGLSKGASDALAARGRIVQVCTSGEAFLAAYRPRGEACLVVGSHLSDMSGLEFLRRLQRAGDCPPAVAITEPSDVHMAVEAMKAGALDCIQRPLSADVLAASVRSALARSMTSARLTTERQAAARRMERLTPRERQVMELVLAGELNKNIAADLGVSQRTVESHRAAIMRKSGAKSLPALVRLTLRVSGPGAGSLRDVGDLSNRPKAKL